ncbi:MAG: hypothetical protein ACOCX3_01645 [Chloroflexota bacterium]
MADPQQPETDGINQYAESALHLALKRWVARPGDRFELKVDGLVIDIVRDHQLIEVQTGNFSALKRKLVRLLDAHPVHVVYPVAQRRWLVTLDSGGKAQRRRQSPKKGEVGQIFSELVYMPDLLAHPGLTLEVLLIEDEEIRVDDGQGSWRRRGVSIRDRRLLAVLHSERFDTPADLLRLLPPDLPATFTTADLSGGVRKRQRLAQQTAYCLKHLGLITEVGRRGRAILYAFPS